jgi:hypothetical protein
MLGESLGFLEEAVDLVGSAVDAATPEDLAVVAEGSGLPLPGEIDAEDERVGGDAEPPAAALLLLSSKATGHQGACVSLAALCCASRWRDSLGHGRPTSLALGDQLWDTKPAMPNLRRPPTPPHFLVSRCVCG